MRSAWFLAFALPACGATVPPAAIAPPHCAAPWHAHVETLASGAVGGRPAGPPGHERAAAYVANEARRLVLRPAGTNV